MGKLPSDRTDLDELRNRNLLDRAKKITAATRAQEEWVARSGLTAQYRRAEGEFGLHGATSAEDVGHWLAMGAPIDGLQQITSYSEDGWRWETPLLTALVDGRLSVARELIRQGADVDALVMQPTLDLQLDLSALHVMVSQKNRDGVRLLLDAGADANFRASDGSTPIWFAAENDDAFAVDALTKAGAHIDILDFTGRRPADVAGPETRGRLKTSAPIMTWQMETSPPPRLLPTVRGELDFEKPVNSGAPEGWRRPSDLTEAFLVAAAMEYKVRLKVNPFNPMARGVLQNLPAWCQYDPLGDLCRYGGQTDDYTSGRIGTGPFALAADSARGEAYSRFPLLQLIWEFLEDVLLREVGRNRDTFTARLQLGEREFGKLGTALVLSALGPVLRGEDELSPLEARFAAGRPFRSRGMGGGVIRWEPSASNNVDSIWYVCFRLVEANSPEYYLRKYAHRVPEISALLTEGGRLGQLHSKLPYSFMHQNSWPGWDFVTAYS